MEPLRVAVAVSRARPLARLVSWVGRRRARVGGHNPWELPVRLARSSAQDRVPGLAAEMAFFALLALVPLLVALGAGLGALEDLVGADQVVRIERGIVGVLNAVFGPGLTDDTLAPLVRGLLSQRRGGLALTGFVIALYLASRVVGVALYALDVAYGAPSSRGLLSRRLLGVVYALLGVVVVMLTFALAIGGPLLGGGEALAHRLGFGEAFALAWQVGRWPVLAAVVVAFFMLVYRVGPNVQQGWRDCLPGAVLGLVLWLGVSLGLRVYLQVTGGVQAPSFAPEKEALAAAGQVVSALIALVLWIYLSSMAMLVGGEFNAELAHSRDQVVPGRGHDH